MIIGIWIVMVISIVVVLREIKYRYFDKRKNLKESRLVFGDWKERVDTDMDGLSMEHTNKEIEDYLLVCYNSYVV